MSSASALFNTTTTWTILRHTVTLFDTIVVLNQQPISWLGFTAVLEAEQTWVLFLLGQTIQLCQFDQTFCPLAWKSTAGKIWFHWNFTQKPELLGTKSLQHSHPSSSTRHVGQQATSSSSSSVIWLKDDKDLGMEGSRQGGTGRERQQKGGRERQMGLHYLFLDLENRPFAKRVSPQYSNQSQRFLQRLAQKASKSMSCSQDS